MSVAVVINPMVIYVYGMRGSTGTCTEVWQRNSALSSLLPMLPVLLNPLLAKFTNFSPQKSERNLAAIAPGTALVSCLMP